MSSLFVDLGVVGEGLVVQPKFVALPAEEPFCLRALLLVKMALVPFGIGADPAKLLLSEVIVFGIGVPALEDGARVIKVPFSTSSCFRIRMICGAELTHPFLFIVDEAGWLDV